MYRAILFATLVLVLDARFGQSSCQDEESHRSVSDEDPSFRLSTRNFLKRYNDIDYDSFVGLMGRRSADADDTPSQRKREMHDIFVGLMGRRSNDADMATPAPISTTDTESTNEPFHIRPHQTKLLISQPPNYAEILEGNKYWWNSPLTLKNSGDTGRPWRREQPETRGLFFNKCRLRFRRGL